MAHHAALTPLTGAIAPSHRVELRALLALAAPLVGANLLQMAVYAIDVVFVARLSTVEFAAATLGVFLYSLMLWALLGLTTACAPLIAAELGRRRHAVREVRRSFRMAMWLAALASLPIMLLLAHGERLLLFADQNPDVARRAGAFLDILLLALVPAIFAGVMRTAAAALGRPGWALGVTAVALGFGALGNWLLVFGHAGFPALGLEGSAIASVVTTTAMMLAYAAILLLDPRLRRYRLLGRWWRPEWSRLREIVRLGVPIASTFVLEGALFGGAAILMGLIGVSEVAAHAIALNIAAFTFQVPLGVAQAATIRVGMAFGARDRAAVGRAGRVALAVGIGFMGMAALMIWSIPRLFVGIYIDLDKPANAAVIALALQYLVVAAVFQLVDGAQSVAAGVLRGIQDARVPMLIAAFGYWVAGFGTAILFGFRFGWRGVGIWTGLAVGLLVVAALLLWRWHARERIGLLHWPTN
ncbi:MATE family efflux transporter [Sphingomonas sp. RT2P30]|uniref:MATE family efflux transporter n=1 Tax=Parasphingomonas halimpatiens TaxID=3096162 RepID=UPI002FC5FCA6